MNKHFNRNIRRIGARAIISLAALAAATGVGFASDRTGSINAHRAPAPQERVVYLAVGEVTRAPIGWIDFCTDHKSECDTQATAARDVVLTPKAWADMAKVNDWVNETIKPVTDLEHWGVVERWSYPDDGRGDCEDYVLLKRRLLMQAGWPREALLITVVRDKKGDGHAVLTVKTNAGEFILDNQETEILAWNKTGYRFVKRQSQTDQNTWVALGEPRAPVAVSAR